MKTMKFNQVDELLKVTNSRGELLLEMLSPSRFQATLFMGDDVISHSEVSCSREELIERAHGVAVELILNDMIENEDNINDAIEEIDSQLNRVLGELVI